MQLRFTSLTVTSSREDLHLQECAHAGRTKKKAPSCDEALKGSLNLKVTKGPEETTRKNGTSDNLESVCQGFPLLYSLRLQKSRV